MVVGGEIGIETHAHASQPSVVLHNAQHSLAVLTNVALPRFGALPRQKLGEYSLLHGAGGPGGGFTLHVPATELQ